MTAYRDSRLRGNDGACAGMTELARERGVLQQLPRLKIITGSVLAMILRSSSTD
jgi:hypothetical protein